MSENRAGGKVVVLTWHGSAKGEQRKEAGDAMSKAEWIAGAIDPGEYEFAAFRSDRLGAVAYFDTTKRSCAGCGVRWRENS